MLAQIIQKIGKSFLIAAVVCFLSAVTFGQSSAGSARGDSGNSGGNKTVPRSLPSFAGCSNSTPPSPWTAVPSSFPVQGGNEYVRIEVRTGYQQTLVNNSYSWEGGRMCWELRNNHGRTLELSYRVHYYGAGGKQMTFYESVPIEPGKVHSDSVMVSKFGENGTFFEVTGARFAGSDSLTPDPKEPTVDDIISQIQQQNQQAAARNKQAVDQVFDSVAKMIDPNAKIPSISETTTNSPTIVVPSQPSYPRIQRNGNPQHDAIVDRYEQRMQEIQANHQRNLAIVDGVFGIIGSLIEANNARERRREAERQRAYEEEQARLELEAYEEAERQRVAAIERERQAAIDRERRKLNNAIENAIVQGGESDALNKAIAAEIEKIPDAPVQPKPKAPEIPEAVISDAPIGEVVFEEPMPLITPIIPNQSVQKPVNVRESKKRLSGGQYEFSFQFENRYDKPIEIEYQVLYFPSYKDNELKLDGKLTIKPGFSETRSVTGVMPSPEYKIISIKFVGSGK